MTAALPPEDDQDVSENAEPTTTYVKRRPRSILMLLIIVLLMAFMAIGGIVMAVTTKHEDPASIQIPVHTVKSLADEQPIAETAPVQTPIEPEPAMMTPQTETDVTPVEPIQPEETPMDMDQSTTMPDFSQPVEPQKSEPHSFLQPQRSVPQTMITLPRPATVHVAIVPKAVKSADGAQIVIVIDDMGLNVRNSRRAAELAAPVTLAYLPYASNLSQQTKDAYAKGHELIVHMPMEPDNVKSNNPGPDALLTRLSAEENVARLKKNLDQFDHYIGLNNHMGSRMTADPKMMRPLLQAVKERGLWFLDSRTIGSSVAGKIAGELGVPYAERDVFLDNIASVSAVMAQLKQTEQIARRKGYAIAIGHPHDATLVALKAWLPQAQAQGFKIVPLSTVIAQRFPSVTIPKYAQTKYLGRKSTAIHAAANNAVTKNN